MTPNEIIETINKMNNEQQTQFYNNLRKNGLSEEEILVIQARAFYAKLFGDPELYSAVRAEMAERVYEGIAK